MQETNPNVDSMSTAGTWAASNDDHVPEEDPINDADLCNQGGKYWSGCGRFAFVAIHAISSKMLATLKV